MTSWYVSIGGNGWANASGDTAEVAMGLPSTGDLEIYIHAYTADGRTGSPPGP